MIWNESVLEGLNIDFYSMYLRIFDSMFLQSKVKTSIKSDVTNPEKQFIFLSPFYTGYSFSEALILLVIVLK